MNFFTRSDANNFCLVFFESALTKSINLYEYILGIKISPPHILFKHLNTKSIPSSRVIVTVILVSVIVNILFFFKLKRWGTIEPLLPKTFPYLTTENLVLILYDNLQQ